MWDEEQNDRRQRVRFAAADGLKDLPGGPSSNGCPRFYDMQQIVIDEIVLRLKHVESDISERVEYLDKLRDYEKREGPALEDSVSVAERREICGDETGDGKNGYGRAAAPTPDDLFVGVRVRLGRLYESEDAILNYECERRAAFEKEIKSLRHEVNALRTRLAEKRDELTTAKMKIDELRVFKNENIFSATSQLREKLKKTTAEHKQCCRVIEEQNHEMNKLKDTVEYLKNILSVKESKIADTENALLHSRNLNDCNKTKDSDITEEIIELENQTSRIETLIIKHNNLPSEDLNQNIDSYNNSNVSKSAISGTRGSESEKTGLSISSIRSINNDTNIDLDSNNEKSELKLAKTKLEEKTALIKMMGRDAEHMEKEFKELKNINEMLSLEKKHLENKNHILEKNEAVFVDRLNDVVIQLEKKQETITKLETLGQKFRAEIQPLQCIKDKLENKLSTYIDCNQTQLERIECLKMINEELKNERDRFLEVNQNNLREIESLQRDNWALKKELLNIEKFKSEVDELKYNNVVLLKDFDDLKLDKERLKIELDKNIDFRRDELMRYQNMLTEQRDKNRHIDIELSKTVKEFQSQVLEQQKRTCSKKENKTFETKQTFTDFDTENTTCDSFKNTIKVLEVALEYEQKTNAENKRQIEAKNTEIEYLHYIKNSQEKSMTNYVLRIKDESSVNNKLQLTLSTLENYVKELENKIEILAAEKLHIISYDDKLKKLENDLTEVFCKNEILSKELTEVLDIKEKTDEQLIEANKKTAEFETYKKKIIALSAELEVKNQTIEAFKHQYENTGVLFMDHQARPDKDKQILELKCDLRLKLENAEKSATEWETKYSTLLNANRDLKNKYENLNIKLNNSENYIKELENKNERFKTKSPCKINEDVVHLEMVNASLTRKLAEFHEKYNKTRTHLEEIKTVITNHNLKNILQENIDLCKTKDKLQKEVFNLKCHFQDLSRKLLEMGENNWPTIDYQDITKVEYFHRALVWQKTYLMRFARGKDELLRLIIQESPGLDKSTIIESLTQMVYADRKSSRFKIVAICLIAFWRMKIITMKHK